MAWPFSTAVAPNFDTGPGLAITTSPVSLVTGLLWLLGAHLTNPGAAEVTVLITDTAGTLVSEALVPGGGELPYEWPFRPVDGLKISATGTGCKAHLWGYQ
jgi:hypothetical protein